MFTIGEDRGTQRAIDVLVALGFTEYEARTYLALLKNNPATGYQISKDSGIPRSMVYEALGRLVHRGAVMSLPSGDTTRYAPVPINTVLDNLRHKYEEALDAAHLELFKHESRTPLEQVWNIDGREAVLARAREMIRQSEREILISVDDRTLLELMQFLEEASFRGVRIRLLLSGDADVKFGEVTRHPQAETALQRTGEGLVLVIDSSQCLVGGTGINGTAIWTGNTHVVFVARQYIWQEIFTQKVLKRLEKEIWTILSPEERRAIIGEV